ncbi:TetR family transcriptional regulator [Tamilnaduibacter salinus]|uniref:TetR family transcriptional regulator n=1 Tax=Tamilnaduibacter salinus TaxID=1484056 RepID=A0A2A2I2M1_9GAMM|nr:TetR family transcriptional regulator [Tamilnaduibacter salinus]PAV26271.1 TetR family transcriptional regulator [Tamilnaduibacter salinus]PVY78014.1 TetR family transcriptional regulator [Tamilnaduibacter salinus]
MTCQDEDAEGRGRSAPDVGLRDAIHYHGRKAARAKSEERRRRILDAALNIAAREGVRGIKHRSVAREAGVPLASTTYYFRDINELISDAFMHFAERSQLALDDFYDTLNQCVDRARQRGDLVTRAGRVRVADDIAELVSDFLIHRFRYHKGSVLTEQVFLVEASRNLDLEQLARYYRSAWSGGLERILQRLETAHPKRDATLLISVVSGMGFDGLLFSDQFNPTFLRESLARVFRLMMGVGAAGTEVTTAEPHWASSS